MDLNNRNILITGASAGIGEALAIKLAHEAAVLILVARRLEKVEELKANILKAHPHLQVILFGKDIISLRENQIHILEELSNQRIDLDILINNAGIGEESLFYESEWEKPKR